MPDAISPTTPSVLQATQSASFDRVPASTETPSAETQDIVDISITESESTPPASTPPTYGPATFSDKFKFELQNGMMDASKRFNAINVRYDTTASTTHETRENLAAQIGATGAQAALFALHHQASDPTPSEASTDVDARTLENRRIDRGLDLLNLL